MSATLLVAIATVGVFYMIKFLLAVKKYRRFCDLVKKFPQDPSHPFWGHLFQVSCKNYTAMHTPCHHYLHLHLHLLSYYYTFLSTSAFTFRNLHTHIHIDKLSYFKIPQTFKFLFRIIYMEYFFRTHLAWQHRFETFSFWQIV